MNPSDLLAQATRLLGEVARLRLDALDDDSLCALTDAVERAGRLIDTTRALAAAEIDDRSRYELGREGLARRQGHARGSHLIETITRASSAEVARRTRLGAQIRTTVAFDGADLPAPFPSVAASMLAGAIGMDAAVTITRTLTQAARHHADPDRLADAEAALVEAAASAPADLIAVQARAWREALDPDGAVPRDHELRERRAFRLGREVNGMTPFSGAADPLSAALLRAAFAEHAAPRIQPRFVDEPESESECEPERDGDRVVNDLIDPRSREQKHFDIVIGLITAGLRSPGTGPGEMCSLSTVMAVVSLDDLQNERGVGWLDDVAEPVSAATVRELACDAGIETVTLGGNGRILDHGMTRRLFSASQRRALAVRDGGCVWVNCTAPPSWCHAHHVLEYSQGGATDIDNGVLLCPAHHHMLHSSAFVMKMVQGAPRLLAPPWLDPHQLWRPLTKRRVRAAA
jgi:hypothetical protein